jgi:hypothetical protein
MTVKTMGTLTKANPNARELVTEILDEAQKATALKLIVEFLRIKTVEQVSVEFGFIRHNTGRKQPPDQVVRLADLEQFIRTGLQEGTIEWRRSSDFVFYALGTDVAFMLCNDADLHFASRDASLLVELGGALSSNGIRVYDSGRLV